MIPRTKDDEVVGTCCNCEWREDSPLPHTGCISANETADILAKLGVTAVVDMVRRIEKLEGDDLLSRVAQIHRECSTWHTHHKHGEDVVRRIEKLEKQMELLGLKSASDFIKLT